MSTPKNIKLIAHIDMATITQEEIIKAKALATKIAKKYGLPLEFQEGEPKSDD